MVSVHEIFHAAEPMVLDQPFRWMLPQFRAELEEIANAPAYPVTTRISREPARSKAPVAWAWSASASRAAHRAGAVPATTRACAASRSAIRRPIGAARKPSLGRMR